MSKVALRGIRIPCSYIFTNHSVGKVFLTPSKQVIWTNTQPSSLYHKTLIEIFNLFINSYIVLLIPLGCVSERHSSSVSVVSRFHSFIARWMAAFLDYDTIGSVYSATLCFAEWVWHPFRLSQNHTLDSSLTGTEDLKTHAYCHQKKLFAGDTVCSLGFVQLLIEFGA